jgi:hypothetical protein
MVALRAGLSYRELWERCHWGNNFSRSLATDAQMAPLW